MNPKNDEKSDFPQRKPLSEKDFIQDESPAKSIKSLPLWLWPFLLAVAISLVLGMQGWYERFLKIEKDKEPFLEVTNREFSLFLWQFPGFLPPNAPKKAGYLPGFQPSRENFNIQTAEDFVSAPPDLLFLYHAWHRELLPEFIAGPIPVKEFQEFLNQLPEWSPQHWQKAPESYVELVESNRYLELEDLQTLPLTSLPIEVRIAFQGWKNYFKEGPEINAIQPTFGQILSFLEKYPHYARPYWRNIDKIGQVQVGGVHYLSGLLDPNVSKESLVPKEQLSSFLRVALFNDSKDDKAQLQKSK